MKCSSKQSLFVKSCATCALKKKGGSYCRRCKSTGLQCNGPACDTCLWVKPALWRNVKVESCSLCGVPGTDGQEWHFDISGNHRRCQTCDDKMRVGSKVSLHAALRSIGETPVPTNHFFARIRLTINQLRGVFE